MVADGVLLMWDLFDSLSRAADLAWDDLSGLEFESLRSGHSGERGIPAVTVVFGSALRRGFG